jgi:pimeloyl-ACP methyl ester carboxylesterase
VSEPKVFKVYDAPHALNAAARRDRLEFLRQQLRLSPLDAAALGGIPDLPQPPPAPPVQRRSAVSPDGVSIVYSAAGSGETALVFIHGGMANRSFFDSQFATLPDRYRVIAIDLAGHGESGRNRETWGIPQFATDVQSVVEAEKLTRVVLFGNSLGGPVAIEAALGLPGRVVGVVGIDTFQDIGHPDTPQYARLAGQAMRQRAERFRTDYPGALAEMVKSLFHPDADPWLVAATERRMQATPPDVAAAMLAGFATYDTNASARRLPVPLRAINGDLYPADVAKIRTVKPDFDVSVMSHTGHYPMLERPDEFNRLVKMVVEGLLSRPQPR